MFGIGMTELVVIMIICLLIFGGSKISGVGRSLGEAITEFKDAVKPQEKDEKPREVKGRSKKTEDEDEVSDAVRDEAE